VAATLSGESQQAVRQAGLLALLRAVQIAAGLLYVALVPRAMGPEMFGQFITLQTMSMWFTTLSGLGAVSLMTRYVPEFVHRGDRDGLRKLTGSLLTMRLTAGLLGAVIYLAIVHLWLKDLDLTVIALVALTIALRTTAGLPFTVLLGLNQASRWGSAELVRRLLLVPLIYAGVRSAGLLGACVAVGLVECCLLCLGLWWSRGHIGAPRRLDRQFLKPFLQFSAMFFASNLVIMLFEQGGTPLVRLIAGDYAEAGYYAIAFGAYLAGAEALWALLSSFGPLFSSLRIKGDTPELRAWIERLLRALALWGVVVAGFLYACADLLVARVLGREYEAVAALLPWLAVAGLAAAPGSIARVLSASFNQGRIALVGAAVQVICFAAVGWILIPRFESVGASVAVAVAASAFSLYNTWRIRSSIFYTMRPWVHVVILGAACSPVLWARNGFAPLRFALFLTVFTGAAAAIGFVRVSDVRMLWHAVRHVPAAPAKDRDEPATVV
jgi:O-antigen/teichoic acid export membrane protein